MKSQAGFDSSIIGELKSIIKSLPKKKITIANIIQELEPEITSAMKSKNYTLDEICKILDEKKQIKIKPQTLKSYLTKARKLNQESKK